MGVGDDGIVAVIDGNIWISNIRCCVLLEAERPGFLDRMVMLRYAWRHGY